MGALPKGAYSSEYERERGNVRTGQGEATKSDTEANEAPHRSKFVYLNSYLLLNNSSSTGVELNWREVRRGSQKCKQSVYFFFFDVPMIFELNRAVCRSSILRPHTLERLALSWLVLVRAQISTHLKKNY